MLYKLYNKSCFMVWGKNTTLPLALAIHPLGIIEGCHTPIIYPSTLQYESLSIDENYNVKI